MVPIVSWALLTGSPLLLRQLGTATLVEPGLYSSLTYWFVGCSSWIAGRKVKPFSTAPTKENRTNVPQCCTSSPPAHQLLKVRVGVSGVAHSLDCRPVSNFRQIRDCLASCDVPIRSRTLPVGVCRPHFPVNLEHGHRPWKIKFAHKNYHWNYTRNNCGKEYIFVSNPKWSKR